MLEYTGLLIFKYTRNNNYYSCILVLNITKAGFQHKPRIFFLFCDLDFMIFFEIVGVVHGYFGHKTWKPFVVFMKLGKKSLNLVGFGVGIHETREKKLNPGGFWWYSWSGGGLSIGASRRSTGAATASWNHPNPPGFNLFFIEFHETTTKTLQVSTYFFTEFHETTNGFNFYGQKYPWNHQKFQKKSWNQVTKKKNARFLFKTSV